MLTFSRSPQKFLPVWIGLAFTLALWLGCKWWWGDFFADPWKYPAKAASLSALMLMCWAVLLSARLGWAERFLGGLDKVYQMHKRLGRLSFFVILAHPLCLAANRLPDVADFARRLWFLDAGGDRYLSGHNLGVASLLLMALLMVLTLWVRWPYHLWKRSHEWFGAVLLLAAIHVTLVEADVAAYPPLALWVWGWLAAALAAFVWIRFLYRRLGPRYAYRIEDIAREGEVLEMRLAPEGRGMDFWPSQFVYMVVDRPGIPPEPHPYSIACGYAPDRRIRLGVKMAGDHTRALAALERGDRVFLYGPYGRFSRRFLAAERDCVFIAGGIGVTPFLGMWNVALHSEDKERHDPPADLAAAHPELVRSWRSPCVAFFYVCQNEGQASFDDDIRREVISSRFHGFAGLEERCHGYELYLSAKQGRFNAAHVREKVPDLLDRYVFLCGPSAMVDGLRVQLREFGLPEDRIIVEDFNLL